MYMESMTAHLKVRGATHHTYLHWGKTWTHGHGMNSNSTVKRHTVRKARQWKEERRMLDMVLASVSW